MTKKKINISKKFLLYTVIISIMTVHFFNLFTTASYAKESPDSIFAKYAVLLDGDTGRVLYGKNENEKAPMASTTKIMTCIVALEYAKENILCTTSAYAASMPDVQLNAVKGEIFSINDLLYSLMLKSHNDTAVIIAENIALHYLYDGDDKDSMSPETNTDEQSRMLVLLFASAMNRKAAELGCHDTYFITPNGLDSEDENGIHSTTARDLATIMAYCIKNQDFLNITQSKNHTFTSSLKTSDNNLKTYNSYSVSNSNAFLDMYDNVISGKTGFTGDAGYCYVCAYRCDGRTFIVALMACGWPNNKTYKWKDTRKLLDYARNTYYPSEIVSKDMQPDDIIIENGNPSVLHLKIENNNGFTALLSQDDKVNVSIHMQTLSAPVLSGETVGEVCAYINDEKIYSLPITAANTIKEKNYVFYLKQLLKRLIFIDKS